MIDFLAGLVVVVGPWLLWKWSGLFTHMLIARFVYKERPDSHEHIRYLMDTPL